MKSFDLGGCVGREMALTQLGTSVFQASPFKTSTMATDLVYLNQRQSISTGCNQFGRVQDIRDDLAGIYS
jgi:hypothetical protein